MWSFLGGHANTDDPTVWANIPAAVKATLGARRWPLDGRGSGPRGTMRLGKIARMSDGTWVDLEIFVLDQYNPANPNNNRLKLVDGGSPFGAINLRGDTADSSSRFRFQLYAHSDACGGKGGDNFRIFNPASCNTPITVALTLTLTLTLALALALTLTLTQTLTLALTLTLTITRWHTTPSPSSISTRSGRDATACARSRRSPCGTRCGTTRPVRSPTSPSRPIGDHAPAALPVPAAPAALVRVRGRGGLTPTLTLTLNLTLT